MRRRKFLSASLGTGIAATIATHSIGSIAQADGWTGCFLSQTEFKHRFESDDGTSSISGLQSDFQSRTSDADLNRALGRTLTRLSRLFSVNPGFGFYHDEQQPNAYATAEVVTAGTDGTVVFGLNLLDRLLNSAPTGISVMGVLAHEFGHIVQTVSPETRVLRGSTARLMELHADYLAGFYAGWRKSKDDSISTNSLGRAFLALGDFNTSHPQHHGTPDERLAALAAGFDFGKIGDKSIGEAVAAGIDEVQRI